MYVCARAFTHTCEHLQGDGRENIGSVLRREHTSEYVDDLLLGVGRKVQRGGRQRGAGAGARLQARQRALREVQRVGHAHQHQPRGPRRPLEHRVQHRLPLAVQLINLVQH